MVLRSYKSGAFVYPSSEEVLADPLQQTLVRACFPKGAESRPWLDYTELLIEVQVRSKVNPRDRPGTPKGNTRGKLLLEKYLISSVCIVSNSPLFRRRNSCGSPTNKPSSCNLRTGYLKTFLAVI